MAKFLTSIDLQKNQLIKARIENLADDPGTPVAGQIYFNTGSGRLRYYTGSAWIELDSAVESITADAPLSVEVEGTTVTISISEANSSTDGFMTMEYAAMLTDATDANTASKLVKRDSNGDFAANMITADLTGDVTGEVSSLANHDTDDLAEGTTNLYYLDTRVQANRLDQMAAPTSSVSFNSQKITSLADPTNPQDAATKAYVDAARQGLDVKRSVRAATTGPVTLATALEAGDTIDTNVTLAIGDRVLVKDQATASQNGIYVVKASGAPDRATDANGTADTGTVSGGTFTFVEEGLVNADSGWVVSSDGPITVGTNPMNWVQFSGAGQIIAGDGLTKDGNTLNVGGTTDRITVGANAVDIAGTYAGQNTISTLGTIVNGVWNGTAVAVAYGGTGASTAADARANLSATTKYATNITGTGAATSFTITHSLNTTDVVVMIYDTLSGNNDVVYAEVRIASVNTITVLFDQAPVGGATPQTYRVVVVG
jgi:hypothetical protein